MEMMLKTKSKKICTILLLMIFLFSLLYNFYLIFTKLNPYFVESDLINEITYRQQCYRQKTLLPDDFIHSNELFATRPVLLYCFFYGFTNNFLLSYQLETMTMLVVQLLAIASLCKCMKMGNNSIIIVMNVFLIWMPESIKKVLWLESDAYALFAICVILTFALRIIWQKGKYNKFSVIGCIFLAALMGFLTLKMSMVLYIPLLIADLIILAGKYKNKRRIEKQNIQLLVLSVIQLVVNLLFYKICLHLFSDKFFPVSMQIADIETMFSWSNIKRRFLELTGIFGMHTLGGELFSGQNIIFIMHSLLFFILVVIIFSLLKKYYAEGGFHLEIIIFIFCVIIFNALVLFALVSGSSCRYYFAAIVFIPVLLGIWADNFEKKNFIEMIAVVVIFLFGGGVIAGYNEIFEKQELPLLQVADYVEEKGYSFIAATYWNAAVIKGYLNGQVEVAHTAPVCNGLAPYYWMIDKNIFDENNPERKYALILTEDEYQNMTDSFTQILLDKYSLEITMVDQYFIFIYSENPYLLMNQIKEKHNAGLPDLEQDYKIVYANNSDLLYKDAELDDNNILVSNGKQTGYVMYGPYTESIVGNYNIKLNYRVEYLNGASVDSEAVFDVALDSQSYRSITCEKNENSVTLENVNIYDGHKYEIRVFAPKGVRMYVYSIEYERLH